MQRRKMRELLRVHGFDERAVCAAYAAAERRGEVRRRSNTLAMDADDYAHRLWHDGQKKGWLS